MSLKDTQNKLIKSNKEVNAAVPQRSMAVNTDIQRRGRGDSGNRSVRWQQRHQGIDIVQPFLELLAGRFQQCFHFHGAESAHGLSASESRLIREISRKNSGIPISDGLPSEAGRPVGVNGVLSVQLDAQLRMQRTGFLFGLV